MSRYINADKLEKDGWTMQRIYQESSTEMVYETKKPTDFPAVDVMGARHAHWYVHGNLHYCSVCHTENDIRTPYCPWCGAKMDEVEDE